MFSEPNGTSYYQFLAVVMTLKTLEEADDIHLSVKLMIFDLTTKHNSALGVRKAVLQSLKKNVVAPNNTK